MAAGRVIELGEDQYLALLRQAAAQRTLARPERQFLAMSQAASSSSVQVVPQGAFSKTEIRRYKSGRVVVKSHGVTDKELEIAALLVVAGLAAYEVEAALGKIPGWFEGLIAKAAQPAKTYGQQAGSTLAGWLKKLGGVDIAPIG